MPFLLELMAEMSDVTQPSQPMSYKTHTITIQNVRPA